MAVNRSFRSAFNGFNRTDVVNYIEESSLEHEKALRQLREENEQLRADLEKLRAEEAAAEEKLAAEEAEKAAEEQEEEAEAGAEKEEMPPEEETRSSEELELAAYRRAEAVERAARTRAAKLCDEVNGIVADTERQLQSSDEDIRALSSDLNLCIRRLADAFAELRLAFDGTTDAFAALDKLEPEEEPAEV